MLDDDSEPLSCARMPSDRPAVAKEGELSPINHLDELLYVEAEFAAFLQHGAERRKIYSVLVIRHPHFIHARAPEFSRESRLSVWLRCQEAFQVENTRATSSCQRPTCLRLFGLKRFDRASPPSLKNGGYPVSL